jgi:exonuclease III
MFIVGSWNIWGLNGLHKQKTIHAWTQKHKLDIFGLLETKIEVANLAALQSNLTPSHWKYHSNIASSPTCRILVGWNT